MKLKPFTLALALTLPLAAHASIQQQINEMYGGLINVTAPGAYETASRGVVTGGAVTLRNRISTANLISITPPSAKGGCGGINLYTGSFSFINGEEFVALMRNVAANAVGVVSGFAFELAMEAMDSATNGVLRNLTNKIQSLNQMFSNSCKLAQGLVTGTMDAFREKRDLKSSLAGVAENVAPDLFSSSSTKEDSPSNRIVTAGKAKLCKDTGNILWCAMKESRMTSQVVFGSYENAEFIMSMVGSYNVINTTDDKGGKTLMPQPIASLKDARLELFVMGTDGESIKLYNCDNDPDCLDPTIRTQSSFQGLATRIVSDLRTNGVFERIEAGLADASDRQRLSWIMRSRVGINLLKITNKAGPAEAYAYLEMFANQLAADAAVVMIGDLLDHTERGLKSIEMADAVKVVSDLKEAKQRLHDEHRTLIAQWGGFTEVDSQARNILEMTPSQDSGKMPLGLVSENSGR